MNQMPFEATVRKAPDTAQIDLAGRIDATAEPELNMAFDQAEAQDPQTIRLNFYQVNYINSTGIALIVALLARARKQKINLEVYGLNEHYREIFRITRLADYMTIFDEPGNKPAGTV